ncbi:unnamed protein product, partial [Phaeothamnion confervicola]
MQEQAPLRCGPNGQPYDPQLLPPQPASGGSKGHYGSPAHNGYGGVYGAVPTVIQTSSATWVPPPRPVLPPTRVVPSRPLRRRLGWEENMQGPPLSSRGMTVGMGALQFEKKSANERPSPPAVIVPGASFSPAPNSPPSPDLAPPPQSRAYILGGGSSGSAPARGGCGGRSGNRYSKRNSGMGRNGGGNRWLEQTEQRQQRGAQYHAGGNGGGGSTGGGGDGGGGAFTALEPD